MQQAFNKQHKLTIHVRKGAGRCNMLIYPHSVLIINTQSINMINNTTQPGSEKKKEKKTNVNIIMFYILLPHFCTSQKSSF